MVTLAARRRPGDAGLEPVHESLDHLHRLLAGMERARATAHGELREQMGTVGQASAQLKQETAALVTALRTPHVRGRWGEVQLRRVVEVAGLLEHCDFVEQPGGTNDEGAGVRPDLVVTLADGKQVVVDAKVPFTGYIEAVQADDRAVRAQRVTVHARQLRAHVDALAVRRYPTAFRPAAPFTVLFVPSDGFLTTALEAEPGLLEYGFARDIVIATPSTLLALLPHGRLLLAAGAAGPRRRPGARGRSAAARPARHAVGAPDRAGSALGRHDGPLQRHGRSVRAVGPDRCPPVRRPRRRREPGTDAEPVEATVRTLRPAELPQIARRTSTTRTRTESRSGTHG